MIDGYSLKSIKSGRRFFGTWRIRAALLYALFFIGLPTVSNAAPVVLQLRWKHQFQFAGYYAALEKGFYADAGLDVAIEEGGYEKHTIDEVTSGRAQFGVTNSEVLLHRLQGKPVVVLAAVFQHSPLTLVTRRDTGILTPQDLVGKRVKFTRKSRDVELHAMLAGEGVALDRIDFVEASVSHDDYFNPRFHALSAYLTNEPFYYREKGIPYTLLRPITYGIDFYGDCLFTSEAMLNRNPEAVRRFRAASLAGWEYAMAHPGELVDLILEKYAPHKNRAHLAFEAEAVRELILPDLVDIGHVNPGRWKHIAATFQRFGWIPSEYTLDGFIYDPDPRPDPRKTRITLFIMLSAVLLVSTIAGFLFFFNKRLQKEVATRKKMAQSLKTSEERYRLLFDNAEVLVSVYNRQGVCLMINKRVAAFMGGEPMQFLNKSIHELHPEAGDEYIRRIRAVIDTGEVREHEDLVHFKTADRWLLSKVQPVRNAAGEIIAGQIISHDISELKRAETALRDSEQYHRTLFENSPTPLVIQDFTRVAEGVAALRMDGVTDLESFLQSHPDKTVELSRAVQVLRMNRAARLFYGVDSEEPKDFSLKQVLLPTDHQHFIDQVVTFTNGGDFYEGEARNTVSSGKTVEIILRKAVIQRETRGLSNILTSFIDVTELNRAHREQEVLKSRLLQAQKMEAIGTLAGGIAHDFNNLLMGIQGRTSLMLLDAPPGTHLHDHLKGVEDIIRTASDLTRQLLGFARGGKYEVKPTDMNDLIRQHHRIFGRTRKEIAIRERFAENLWTVEVDRSQIQQVLLNLYVNAWQAMPTGGSITVRTENLVCGADCVKRYGGRPGRYVKVSVADTGVGMAPDVLERIFDPFFTTREMGRGTGLGLSSTFGIIKNHGGFISVESEKGKGAVFMVHLPVAESPPVKERVPPDSG